MIELRNSWTSYLKLPRRVWSFQRNQHFTNKQHTNSLSREIPASRVILCRSSWVGFEVRCRRPRSRYNEDYGTKDANHENTRRTRLSFSWKNDTSSSQYYHPTKQNQMIHCIFTPSTILRISIVAQQQENETWFKLCRCSYSMLRLSSTQQQQSHTYTYNSTKEYT